MGIPTQVRDMSIYDWDMIKKAFIIDEAYHTLKFETIKYDFQSLLKSHNNQDQLYKMTFDELLCKTNHNYYIRSFREYYI